MVSRAREQGKEQGDDRRCDEDTVYGTGSYTLGDTEHCEYGEYGHNDDQDLDGVESRGEGAG